MAGFAILTTGVLAFGSLIVRWRRGAVQEKQQMKLVVFAGFLLVGLIMVGAVFGEQGFWGVAPFVFGLNAIAVAIAVAIVKYHLYDIDRIILRTPAYTVVIGVLGALFVLIVSLPGFFIGGFSETANCGPAPPIVVAISTLAVAALFNPLRRRVIRWWTAASIEPAITPSRFSTSSPSTSTVRHK